MPLGTVANFADYLGFDGWRTGVPLLERAVVATRPRSFRPNAYPIIYDVTGWQWYPIDVNNENSRNSLSITPLHGFDNNGITSANRVRVDQIFTDLNARFGIQSRRRRETGRNRDSNSSVDIFFRDDALFDSNTAFSLQTLQSDGNSNFSNDHRWVREGEINVNIPNGSSLQLLSTYYHEILHFLGLWHAGPYNGNGFSVPDSLLFDNESAQMSIMSYARTLDPNDSSTASSDSVNPSVAGSNGATVTPMPADIELLRTYYGRNRAFNGDTVYGSGTNISDDQSPIMRLLSDPSNLGRLRFTLQDDSGVDVLNFRNGFNQTINLTPQVLNTAELVASSVGGGTNNMFLAVGTIIENVNTGWGRDVVTGNQANNNIDTGFGVDRITTGAGRDVVAFRLGRSTISDSTASDPDTITDFNHASRALLVRPSNWPSVRTQRPSLVYRSTGDRLRILDSQGESIQVSSLDMYQEAVQPDNPPFSQLFEGLPRLGARIVNTSGDYTLLLVNNNSLGLQSADLVIKLEGNPFANGIVGTSITSSTLFA